MILDGEWRKATKSNNNGAPVLSFTPAEIDAFFDGVRKGEFEVA